VVVPGPQTASPRRRKSRLTLLAEVTGILAAVTGVMGFFIMTIPMLFGGDDNNPAPEPGGLASSVAATSAPAEPTGPTAQEASVVYLTDLIPAIGAGNLTELPRELRGRPEYARSLVIQCPSGNTNDRHRDIGYDLRGRFIQFETTVRPYSLESTGPVLGLTQVDVYGEAQELASEIVEVGAVMHLTVDIEDVNRFTLRITCEDPDDIVILTDPRILAETDGGAG